MGVASISGHGHQPLADLEEGLVDNLLNFAGTPKVSLQIPEPSLLTYHADHSGE